MKYSKIKNNTRQGLEVIVKDSNGKFDHIWLSPKNSVVVPSKYITDLVKRAAKRELISILPI